MSDLAIVIDYDPNKFSLFHESTHKVKLIFGMWKYRAEVIKEVGGNCSGLSVINSAIDSVYEELPCLKGTKIPFIMMTDEQGNTLECADEEDDGYEFLPSMLLCAEITDFTSKK